MLLVFDLTRLQACVTMVLVLVFSIRPLSGFPYAQHDEDPTVAKDSLDNEEDRASFQDEDGSSEEDYTFEVTGIEFDHKKQDGEKTAEESCAGVYQKCNDIPCCSRFYCVKSILNFKCNPKPYSIKKTFDFED